jgi:hypothetical protein
MATADREAFDAVALFQRIALRPQGPGATAVAATSKQKSKKTIREEIS